MQPGHLSLEIFYYKNKIQPNPFYSLIKLSFKFYPFFITKIIFFYFPMYKLNLSMVKFNFEN